MEGTIQKFQDYFLWIIENYKMAVEKEGILRSPLIEFSDRIWSLELNTTLSSWLILVLKNYCEGKESDQVTLGLKINESYSQLKAVPNKYGRKFTVPKVIRISELHESPNVQILPKGALTIFCKICTREKNGEKFNKKQLESKSILKLQEDLKNLFYSGRNSDVLLYLNSRLNIRAHTNILAARSPIFAAMFTNYHYCESVKIMEEDCEPDIFYDFVRYLYTGEVEMSLQKAEQLCSLAEKYRVCELKKECEDFITKNTENVSQTAFDSA